MGKKFNTAEECHIGIPKIPKKNDSFESHRHEPSSSVCEWSQLGTSASQNTSGDQSQVSHDAGEEKKVQNRKESHFCGTYSQGGESKRRLLAITDRVCCLMLCLVTVWRSCGYTKFAVGEESGLVAGRVRGCSCSHHIWGLRGQMCAR